MNRMEFMAMCFYYYGSEFFKLAFYALGVLACMFMIYKLVGWALWVMSL